MSSSEDIETYCFSFESGNESGDDGEMREDARGQEAEGMTGTKGTEGAEDSST